VRFWCNAETYVSDFHLVAASELKLMAASELKLMAASELKLMTVVMYINNRIYNQLIIIFF
jgi:hypothetical protein